jgi:hypothetical protein
MERIYPFRTTLDKLEHAHRQVTESGDEVLERHWVGGRDWVLICRKTAER